MQPEKIILLPTTHESLPSFHVQRDLLSSFLDHLANCGIKVVEPPEPQGDSKQGAAPDRCSGCAVGHPNPQAPGGARITLVLEESDYRGRPAADQQTATKLCSKIGLERIRDRFRPKVANHAAEGTFWASSESQALRKGLNRRTI